jgi:hypothetical protein
MRVPNTLSSPFLERKQITPECGDGGSCDTVQSQQLGRDATLSVGQGDDSLHLIVTVLIKGEGEPRGVPTLYTAWFFLVSPCSTSLSLISAVMVFCGLLGSGVVGPDPVDP